MARVNKDEKWGFINTSGELIIDLKYDYVEPFTNGKSKVIFADETFFIDMNGKRLY